MLITTAADEVRRIEIQWRNVAAYGIEFRSSGTAAIAGAAVKILHEEYLPKSSEKKNRIHKICEFGTKFERL